MTAKPRSLFDELLELALYVPVGIAARVLDKVPELAAAGRQRVGGQVDQARVIGRIAVGLARSKGLGALGGVGTRPTPPERRPTPEGADREREATVAPPPAPQPARTAPAAEGEQPAPPQAIADYDALSASQVVPRLSGLTAEELAAIGRYEAATRRRRTILNKIAQLERDLGTR